MTHTDQSAVDTKHSRSPWSYEYSPYTVRNTAQSADDTEEQELAAFEVFDAEGNKVFDTNEDTPAELQEANARLGAVAPELLAALRAFVAIDDLSAECAEWKWENLDKAFATARQLIAEATAT